MVDALAHPRLGAGLAAARHRPEAPYLRAGGLIVRRDEAADALVTAGHARDDEIPNRQRSAGRAVVLAPVRHLGVPQQRPGRPVERDEVGMVGGHEYAIAGNRRAAVDAAAGVANLSLRARPLVVPDLTSGARVERVALVAAGHVHHAASHDRRPLQPRRVRQVEKPLGRETGHVALVDLRQRAVPVALGLAVVARPIRLRGNRPVALSALTQQMDAAVVTEELQIGEALVLDETRDRAAVDERDSSPFGARAVTRLQRPQVANERRRFAGTEIRHGGHARRWQAVTKERDEILVGPDGNPRRNRRTGFSAIPVGAMAPGAAVDERLLARVRRLRRGRGGHEQDARERRDPTGDR